MCCGLWGDIAPRWKKTKLRTSLWYLREPDGQNNNIRARKIKRLDPHSVSLLPRSTQHVLWTYTLRRYVSPIALAVLAASCSFSPIDHQSGRLPLWLPSRILPRDPCASQPALFEEWYLHKKITKGLEPKMAALELLDWASRLRWGGRSLERWRHWCPRSLSQHQVEKFSFLAIQKRPLLR